MFARLPIPFYAITVGWIPMSSMFERSVEAAESGRQVWVH